MTSSAAPLRTAMIVSGCADDQFRDKIWNITSSGFNTLILTSLRVDDRGTISIDEMPIVSAGKYVGPPDLPETLKSLLSGSVTRLGFSFGSGDLTARDFQTMWSVFVQPAKEIHYVHDMFPTNNMLVRNMLTLRSQFDFIDFVAVNCQEFTSTTDTSYDWIETAASFGYLINAVGFKVSLCPVATALFDPASNYLRYSNIYTVLWQQSVKIDAIYFRNDGGTCVSYWKFVGAVWDRLQSASSNTVLSDLPRIVPILTAINQQQQGINGMTPDQVQNELATYPTLNAMTPGGALFGPVTVSGGGILDFDRIANSQYAPLQYLRAITNGLANQPSAPAT